MTMEMVRVKRMEVMMMEMGEGDGGDDDGVGEGVRRGVKRKVGRKGEDLAKKMRAEGGGEGTGLGVAGDLGAGGSGGTGQGECNLRDGVLAGLKEIKEGIFGGSRVGGDNRYFGGD